ncbi:MAG: hypothetical protein ACLRPU_00805 [Enterococcus hulanensis]
MKLKSNLNNYYSKIKGFCLNKGSVFIPLIVSIIIALVITVPFFQRNIIFVHDDFSFHRMRLEGYFEAVKLGHFFPKILPEMANGYGYAADLFYPSIFLLPYAVLRLLGFSYIHSYYGYMLIISATTFLVAYYSAKQMFQNIRIGYFFALIYTTATYRLLDQFIRGALGETLAFIFLPLILLGIYQIFYLKENRWTLLAIGMSSVIYSHMITSLLVVISIGCFLMYQLFTHKLSKTIIITFLKSVGMSFLLSAYVILPILEQNYYVRFNYLENKGLWDIGLTYSPADLLFNSFANSADNWTNLKPNIGFIFILFILLALINFNKLSKISRTMLLVGIGYSLLATNIFPWSANRTNFLSFIQFPWRILTLATLFLSLSLSLCIEKIRKKYVLVCMSLLIIGVTFSYTKNIIYSFESNNVSQIDNKSYSNFAPNSIGGGKEYLSIDTDFEKIEKNPKNTPEQSSAVRIVQKEKGFNFFKYEIYTNSENYAVSLPKIAYPGYSIKINNKETAVYAQDGLLTFDANKDKQDVTVKYVGTILQDLSLSISMLSWLFLLINFLIRRFKTN